MHFLFRKINVTFATMHFQTKILVISRDWKPTVDPPHFGQDSIFFSAYYGILPLVPKFFDKKLKDQLRKKKPKKTTCLFDKDHLIKKIRVNNFAF